MYSHSVFLFQLGSSAQSDVPCVIMKLLFFVISILITLRWGDATSPGTDIPVDITNYLRPGLCPGPPIPTLGLFIDPGNGIPTPVPSP